MIVSTSPRVAVVGGGMGGVAAAILLQRAGYKVTVFEQAEELARIGAGINMGPNAVRIMRHLGLEDELIRIGIRPRQRLSREWNTGRVLYSVPLSDFPSLYNAPLVTIHRGDLQTLLTSALAPGSLELGKRLIDLGQEAGAVNLKFADGSTAEADIVIGADGINSIVREILLGPEPPTYTGNVAYRSIFPSARLPSQVTDHTKWWGDDRHILIYYLSDRRDEIYFVTGVPQPKWDNDDFSPVVADPDELREAFAGFHAEVQSVLAACPQASKWPILERQPLPLWSQGRVVMLGDACHPMPPHMGQGAAMAFEDAVMLVRCIEHCRGQDPSAAFALYEANRFARTSRVQRESHNNEWMRHGMDHGWVFGYDATTEPLVIPASAEHGLAH